jgi:DNA-binding NarL/FixJ family response regulator
LWNEKPHLVIINPLFIQHNMKLFVNTRNTHCSVKWAGILYTFCNKEVTSMLDGNFQITDSVDDIVNLIETLTSRTEEAAKLLEKQYLTCRETDILKLILQGMSNKEIAASLYVSVHTVISHRRKIFLKTRTNNPYCLLNWAISNQIINLKDGSPVFQRRGNLEK